MAPPDPVDDILPRAGERSLIIGATGSGKTGLMVYFARRMPQSPIIVYDSKGEDKFTSLPNAVVCSTWGEVEDNFDKQGVDYIIFRPSPEEASDPETMDGYLLQHYHRFDGVPAFLDEIMQFHISSSRAGPGLTALLTRGRSRGITTVMGTQRPAFVSGFVYSETQAFYVLHLTMEKDRKRVADFIPNYDEVQNPTDHAFYLYRAGRDEGQEQPAVALDKGVDTGYTIGRKSQPSSEPPPPPALELHHWV